MGGSSHKQIFQGSADEEESKSFSSNRQTKLKAGHMADTEVEMTIAAAYERVRTVSDNPFEHVVVQGHACGQKETIERLVKRRKFLEGGSKSI